MKQIIVSERRNEKRIPVNQRCWCEGQDVTLFGRITNASHRGAFLRTAASLRIGEPARLVWDTPSGDRTEIRAEVMWISGSRSATEPGLGLRLVQIERGENLWKALLSDHGTSLLEN